MGPRKCAAACSVLGFLGLTVPTEAAASSLTLSVASGTRVQVGVGREWYGTVVLTVPFDAFVAPCPVVPPPASPDATWDPLVPIDRVYGAFATEPAVNDGGTPPAPPRPPERAAPSSPPARQPETPAIDLELARAVVHHALRAAGHPATRRRLFSMASRARTSGLLPELRLAGGRSTDATLRLTPTLTDPDRYTQSGGTDLWAEARLTFRLDRLLFADEELSVQRLQDQNDDAAMRLVSRTLEIFFAWQRARLSASSPALLPEEQLAAAIEAAEAEITLDVMTNGWFSARVARRAKKRTP